MVHAKNKAEGGGVSDRSEWTAEETQPGNKDGMEFFPVPPNEFALLCHYGSREEVVEQIEKGADVNAHGVLLYQNNKNMHFLTTPLFEAVVHNTPEVVSVLLEAGAKVNIQDLSAMTPLALAASRGSDLETVKLLLQFGADIEEMSPLWHAIDHRADIQIVAELIARGANVNAIDESGISVMHQAAHYSQALPLLIEAGGDVNCRNGFFALGCIL